jgi:hypothetical protein
MTYVSVHITADEAYFWNWQTLERAEHFAKNDSKPKDDGGRASLSCVFENSEVIAIYHGGVRCEIKSEQALGIDEAKIQRLRDMGVTVL